MTYQTPSQHWSGWTSQYISSTISQSIKNFFSKDNLNIFKSSYGLFSIPLYIISSIIIAYRYSNKTVSILMACTIMPLVIFWGIMNGNSARHNLIPSVFLYLCLAIPICYSVKNIWIAILVLMCTGNYFFSQESSSTVYPSARIFPSANLILERVEYLHDKGKELAKIQKEKIAILGSGPAQPYFQYEIITHRDLNFESFSVPSQYVNVLKMRKKDGTTKEYYMDYNPKTQDEISKLINEGYFVLQ